MLVEKVIGPTRLFVLCMHFFLMNKLNLEKFAFQVMYRNLLEFLGINDSWL